MNNIVRFKYKILLKENLSLLRQLNSFLVYHYGVVLTGIYTEYYEPFLFFQDEIPSPQLTGFSICDNNGTGLNGATTASGKQ